MYKIERADVVIKFLANHFFRGSKNDIEMIVLVPTIVLLLKDRIIKTLIPNKSIIFYASGCLKGIKRVIYISSINLVEIKSSSFNYNLFGSKQNFPQQVQNWRTDCLVIKQTRSSPVFD